jgi:hypothetical protein
MHRIVLPRAFGAAVTEGWIDCFLGRRKAELFGTVDRLPENPQFEIPRLFLDAMVECRKQCVPDCCAELVFN